MVIPEVAPPSRLVLGHPPPCDSNPPNRIIRLPVDLAPHPTSSALISRRLIVTSRRNLSSASSVVLPHCCW